MAMILFNWFNDLPEIISLSHTTGAELMADKLLARNVPVTLDDNVIVNTDKEIQRYPHENTGIKSNICRGLR